MSVTIDSGCDNLSPEDTCMYGYSERLSKAVKDGTPMCEELRRKVVEYERDLQELRLLPSKL